MAQLGRPRYGRFENCFQEESSVEGTVHSDLRIPLIMPSANDEEFFAKSLILL